MAGRTLLTALALLAALSACRTDPYAYRGRTVATPQAESMARMIADVDVIRAFVKGDGAAAEAEAAAADLRQWSERMAELFPPGVAPRQYPDLTEAMARAAPAAMRTSSERLLAAARTGDRAAVARSLAAVEREGCGLCHRSP